MDVDADARVVLSFTEAEEGCDGKLGSAFGSWPGPPLDAKETAKETATAKRGGAGGFLDAQLAPDLDPGLRSEARAAALGVQRDNPLALAHFANHPPKGTRPNVVVAGVDVVFRGGQVASLRPFLPNAALGRWPEPTSREGVAARQAARAKRGWFAARLHDLFGEEDDDSADEPAAAAAEATAVVPALALVASEALRDEEVFLNYRLSTHVERPEWYHPVDAEEDKRRWASD